MECQCSDNSQLFISWLFPIRQSIYYIYYLQQEQSFRIAVKWNSDFEKLKKASEGWYIVSEKNKSLYFSDLRFGLLNDNPENPQFAFSYEFNATESD
jgi:inner membrane protein